MLNVNDISVSYGGHYAVKKATLRVEKGEVVAVIGANGAGKSTILNSIAGLITREGSIYFKNTNITKKSSHEIVEMGLVLVPQGRRLFPGMTVEENIRLGAFTLRARKNIENTKEQVFELFPLLKARRSQIAKTLSGGEQQMLAIGRGIMSLPELLMLDEPSIGLSPIMVTHIFEVMQEILKSGVTILLVEQNLNTTLNFTDRAYIIENGKIAIEGKSNELIDNKHVKEAYLGVSKLKN